MVINIGTQGSTWNPTLTHIDGTGHFGSTQATSNLNPDSLSTLANCLLNRTFHRALIADATFKLLCNIIRHQVCVQIRALDLFDFEIDLLANHGFKMLAKTLDTFTFTTDQHTGLGCVNNDLHLTRK